MNYNEKIIQSTQKWIKEVIIACNFCPFAAAALHKKSIKYIVLNKSNLETHLNSFQLECEYLDEDENIETTFIIFDTDYVEFDEYLDLIDVCEEYLTDNNYEGIYQIASFHPEYCFEGADPLDAANYTNRSPYPMIHLLRESSIDKALIHFEHPENIPERNIQYAREKGLKYMQMLRTACM